MTNPTFLIRILIFIAFLLLIDIYAFQAFRTAFREQPVMRWVYWIFSALAWVFVIYSFITFNREKGFSHNFMYFMAFMLLSLLPKLIVVTLMVSEDVVRLIVGVVNSVSGHSGAHFMPDRRKFVSQTALVLAAIPFLGIIHGVIFGRYRFRVIRKELAFDDLPEAFDGLTITQVSDIHSGSFDNFDKIKYGVDLINEQQSDLILFTGDLVNNKAEEMEPWVDLFSELKAPMGKFSILGNHDYGDYVEWESAEAKHQNMLYLYDIHERLGFRLLRNENIKLTKDGASIRLVGVENWGAGGFSKHGDLAQASAGISHDSFNILMSHDPSHFDAVVKGFEKLMHLTLSGHTHGMQFGIEIPGWIKWSPVKYRYPKWAGLYESNDRKLYVNRGFGFLAFPGRVGIWPEVTVFTLKKKDTTTT